MQNNTNQKLEIVIVQVKDLNPAPYNPRKWSDEAITTLTSSIKSYGLVDPILLNSAPERMNVVVGGHMRLKCAKDLGFTEMPAVYVNLPDIEQEKKLNLLLNRATGDWDWELLSKFDETMLDEVGFTSEELDLIFNIELDEPEQFDLEKELAKLDITNITVQKGDVYKLGDSRLMCGDSTISEDFDNLMSGELADMTFTDPPYRLSYLKGGIRHGKPTEGFGSKRNRKYLETDELPEDFTELWMANVAKHANANHSIIVYEAWHNLREIWGEMEKYFKVRNMIVWHLPNRHQGFSAKYKFFSKYDIAMVGSSGTVEYNHDEEPDGLQEEYETALYATSGKPNWEGYNRGKKYQPTDFIEYQADDLKSSGQGVIFGTKPLEILIPYIKVLTKRDDLVVEPFCGSGSTLIASTKLHRRCFIMEKSPTYAEVALKRWEKLTGLKREKLS